jgi:hypothetical protein
MENGDVPLAYPQFILDEMKRAECNKVWEPALGKFRVGQEPSPVENLKFALLGSRGREIMGVFSDLAGRGKLGLVDDMVLRDMARWAAKAGRHVPAEVTALIFYELLIVRETKTLGSIMLGEALRTIAGLGELDLVMACLIAYRKGNGKFTPNLAGTISIAYSRALGSAGLPVASRLVQYVFETLNPGKIAAFPLDAFREIIAISPSKEAKQLHSIALLHYVELRTVPGNDRFKLDACLARVHGSEGLLEECEAMMKIYEDALPPEVKASPRQIPRAKMVGEFRAQVIVALVRTGDVEKAEKLHREWAKDDTEVVAMAGDLVLMELMDSQGRKKDLDAFFNKRVGQLYRLGPKGKVYPRAELYELYFRLVLPDLDKAGKLIEDIGRARYPMSDLAKTSLAAAFLRTQGDLGSLIKAHRGKYPYPNDWVIPPHLFMAMMAGVGSMRQLPRVWYEFVLPLLHRTKPNREAWSTARWLSDESPRGFLAFLEKRLTSKSKEGKSGADWVEEIRSELKGFMERNAG